jgi:hypothetical protein
MEIWQQILCLTIWIIWRVVRVERGVWTTPLFWGVQQQTGGRISTQKRAATCLAKPLGAG